MSFQDKSNLMALRISASTVDKARENYVKAVIKHEGLTDKALADGTDRAAVMEHYRSVPDEVYDA